MCEQALRSFAHITVGLDGMHGAACAQKERGRNAGARADICNDGLRRERGFALQPWSIQGQTGINYSVAFSRLTLY